MYFLLDVLGRYRRCKSCPEQQGSRKGALQRQTAHIMFQESKFSILEEGKKKKKQIAGRKTFFFVSVLMRIFLWIQFDFKTKTKQ